MYRLAIALCLVGLIAMPMQYAAEEQTTYGSFAIEHATVIDVATADRTVQDEMAGFVEAGLTPLQALQTATTNPAIFFKMPDQLGSVEAGKLADLLLLDGDPTVDITNTKRISAIVIDGRLIDSELRQKLLNDEQMKRKAASQSN